jgi:hypothetical protein
MYALEIHPETSPPAGHSLVNSHVRKIMTAKTVIIEKSMSTRPYLLVAASFNRDIALFMLEDICAFTLYQTHLVQELFIIHHYIVCFDHPLKIFRANLSTTISKKII